MGYKSSLGQFLKKAYCVVFFILVMDRMDNAPAGVFSALRKLKYIYLVLLVVYLFTNVLGGGAKKREGSVLFVTSIFVVHTLLWGLVFTNNKLIPDTRLHMREMLLLLLFIFGTTLLYSREGSVEEFAEHSFICYFVTLVWAGLTHPSNFVNPVKFVYVLGGDHAFRVAFGLGHANYVGSICGCTLLCAVYIFERNRNHSSLKSVLNNRKMRRLVLAVIYVGEMLFSTASRTAILAFTFSMVIYVFVYIDELFPSHKAGSKRITLVIIGSLITLVLVTQGFFNELLSESHRDSLISTNYDIMVNNFSLWTGMGYINYNGFAFGVWAYGFQTVNADSYYAYVFFASGVIGMLIIVFALLVISAEVVKKSYRYKEYLGIMALVSFLFLGVAQASLLSYDHLTSYTYCILLFLTMAEAFISKTQEARRPYTLR